MDMDKSMNNSGPHFRTVKEAVTAARWEYRCLRITRNSYAVFREGVQITEPAAADEAGVDLVEHVATGALRLLGIERAADLVAEVLDAGCDLRADWVAQRAAKLAGFRYVRKPRAGGKAIEARGYV